MAPHSVSLLSCLLCGTAFLTDNPEKNFCSSRCSKLHYDRAYNAERGRAQWDRSPRACPRCTNEFEPEHVLQSYCSTSCRDSAKRRRERDKGTRARTHRERALQYGRRYEVISPQTIFARDKWICQLCRKPVQRDKRAPHPKSPTLDHIIPMSVEGGDHVPENVHTAHFICNSTRGTGGTVQLLLIG